jgi:DNA-binding phage protein
MRDWMSADDHESNTPEHTKSSEAYRNYVHNNLEDQTGKYITAQLGRLFSDDLETNMYLKSELSDFLTSLENRKRDDNTHSQIDA